MKDHTKETVDERLRSGDIIEQKNWEFIRELNSCSEDRLNATALKDGGREYSYRQMFRRWERYSAVFSELGIGEKHRSRAALTGLPCSETLFAYFALNMTGASVSMVYQMDMEDEEVWENVVKEEHITDIILTDYKTSPAMLRSLLRSKYRLGIRNIIIMSVPVRGDLADWGEPEAAERNRRRLRRFRGVLFMDDLLRQYEGYPACTGKGGQDETAVIVHTTGTTSAVHKPVPMSDRALNESSARLLRDDRFAMLHGTAVSCLFLHVAGGFAFFDMMLLPLAFGGKIIMMPAFETHPDRMRAMIRYGGNVMFSMPHMFEMLIRLPIRPDLSSLKFVFMGAAYASLEAKKRYDKYLEECGADVKISIGYGMTEMGGACLLSPPDPDKTMIGYPLPGVKAMICDEIDEKYYRIEDGPRTGGLLLSSAGLSGGRLGSRTYFELIEIDGDKYLDTNDLVDVNEDGSITYVGRTNRYFVNQEGVRFDAGLVETAVSQQPDIESCGLAPVLDKLKHDTVPVLYVQVADSAKDPVKTLTEALRNAFIVEGRIKETNLPTQCVITDHIPYNAGGKVDVHKIISQEIEGRTFDIEAEYSDGELTGIKLIETEYAPGQSRPFLFRRR